MANRRILVVEDEQTLRRIVADTLIRAGYEVIVAADGEEGLREAERHTPHLVITDIMMPRMDGIELVKTLSRRLRDTQFLFLSARSGADDVVEGFRAGGNDYIRKPFAMNELLVRVEALLSRTSDYDAVPTNIEIGRYSYNTSTWTLAYGDSLRRLSAREAAVLTALAMNRNKVVSTRSLLMDIWGDDSYYNLRSLNVFVSKLRGYLSDDKSIEIVAIRGVGYKIGVREEE